MKKTLSVLMGSMILTSLPAFALDIECVSIKESLLISATSSDHKSFDMTVNNVDTSNLKMSILPDFAGVELDLALIGNTENKKPVVGSSVLAIAIPHGSNFKLNIATKGSIITAVTEKMTTQSELVCSVEQSPGALVKELTDLEDSSGSVKEITGQLRRITQAIDKIDAAINEEGMKEDSDGRIKALGALLDEANELSNIANQRLTSLTVTKKAADQIEFLALKSALISK